MNVHVQLTYINLEIEPILAIQGHRSEWSRFVTNIARYKGESVYPQQCQQLQSTCFFLLCLRVPRLVISSGIVFVSYVSCNLYARIHRICEWSLRHQVIVSVCILQSLLELHLWMHDTASFCRLWLLQACSVVAQSSLYWPRTSLSCNHDSIIVAAIAITASTTMIVMFIVSSAGIDISIWNVTSSCVSQLSSMWSSCSSALYNITVLVSIQ